MKLFSVVNALLIVCIGLIASKANAVATINNPETVAMVNNFALPKASVDLLYESVSQGKRPMRYRDLVNGLIENRLLAEYAEKTLGMETLMSNTSVGFPISTYLEDQYVGLIQASYHQSLSVYIKNNIGETPDVITTRYLNEKVEAIQRILDIGNRMEYQLTDAQTDSAKQLVIAHYQLPDEQPQSVTLYDVYHRQNIQGRISIHQLNMDFISAQISQLVSLKTVSWWAEKQSGLKQTDIEALKRFIADRHYKQKVINYHGMNTDIHDDNPALEKAFKEVSQAEIDQYYKKNKDKFRHIDYVDARHIRLADLESAQKVQAELEGGMDFSEAAANYSIAPSKSAAPPGSIGRLKGNDGGSEWSKSAVFALKKGIISRPIRSPQADGKTVYWEIFLVDERKEGYLDAKSETVRYLAGKEIARNKLEQRFLETRKSLFKKADIKLNTDLMKQ